MYGKNERDEQASFYNKGFINSLGLFALEPYETYGG